jgi:hypothetical protein
MRSMIPAMRRERGGWHVVVAMLLAVAADGPYGVHYIPYALNTPNSVWVARMCYADAAARGWAHGHVSTCHVC